MKREYLLFIRDILECIEKIEEFTQDMSFDEFEEDDKTASAVVNKLEIIGEASKNIPGHIKENFKNIPWKDMARMRDKLTHAYFIVDYEIVWKVIKERLPKIRPLFEQILQ